MVAFIDPLEVEQKKPAFVDPLEQQAKPPTTPSPPGVLEKAGKWAGETAKDVGRFVSDPKKLGRLTFEMAGAGVGGALGAGSGLLTGPGAVVASPVGGIVGGGLGYAFGDKLADIIWGERLPPEKAGKVGPQLWQSTKDFGTGLAYAGTGKAMDITGRGVTAGLEATGRLAKRVWHGEPITGSGIMPWMTGKVENIAARQAAKKIASATSKVPGTLVQGLSNAEVAKKIASPPSPVSALEAQVGKNIEAAQKLEADIPGLRFNIGQQTGDPNLLSLARAQSQAGGTGAAKSGESVMAQNEAVRNYIKQHIRGGGTIDDFLASVQAEQNRLAGQTATIGRAAESEATKIAGRGEQEVGASLLEKARQGRTLGAKEAKGLYEKVPETLKVDATPLWEKVDSLFGSFDALTQRLGATPTGPMSRIREAMKPELVDATGRRIAPMAGMPAELTMKQIKDFRSQIGATQRSALVNRDYELAYNLGQLKDGVNDTLKLAAESGEGAGIEALKKATAYWRDTYVPKFRQGPTGKILEVGRTGEQAITDSSIGGQFFKPGKGASEAADNFNYVFGKDPEAKELIRDYASQSLLKYARNPATGELESKRIASWLYQHGTALEKLGFKGEFGSLQKAMKMADGARGVELAFNKTSLAKSLNIDPDRAIAQALMTGTGRKQSIQRLQEMVRLAKQDKTGSSMLGLKAGIGDYFQTQTLTAARDLAGNRLVSLAKMDRFMDGFRPALKQSGLYTPYELKAFDNVHNAIQAIARQQSPTPGFVGSPTPEILARMAASGTSIALGHMGIYGASLGIFQRIIKFVVKERVDEALARAVFDPRYAAAISGLAYNANKLPAQRAAKIFNQQMLTLGLMAKERPKAINRMIRPDPSTYEMGPTASGTGLMPTYNHPQYESE